MVHGFYGRVMRDVELFTQYIIQYPEFKTMLGLGASHMRSQYHMVFLHWDFTLQKNDKMSFTKNMKKNNKTCILICRTDSETKKMGKWEQSNCSINRKKTCYITIDCKT